MTGANEITAALVAEARADERERAIQVIRDYPFPLGAKNAIINRIRALAAAEEDDDA